MRADTLRTIWLTSFCVMVVGCNEGTITQENALYDTYGIILQPLTEDRAEQLGFPGLTGVLVVDVATGSPADQAGFRINDLIVEADGQAVSKPRELLGALNDGTAVLRIRRQGGEEIELSLSRMSLCRSGATRICGSPVGVCRTGTQTCLSTETWGACEGGVQAGEEICATDEDEDCDGLIDEGCECQPGDARACGNGVGTCKKGVQSCVAGRWAGECVGAVLPVQESCNGEDDDCDGMADDGSNACGGACILANAPGTGCDATSADDKDTCADDAFMCSAANITVCTNGGVDSDSDGYSAGSSSCHGDCSDVDARVFPGAPELCDGKDNDCNDVVDEGCIPSFPGAEGFGGRTPGGRGPGRADTSLGIPKVFVVTNLCDYDRANPSDTPEPNCDVDSNGQIPGSLRWAIEEPYGHVFTEPRFVVFAVSGTVILKDDIRIKNPFITVAGQTAPGGGIALRRNGLQIRETHNVIIRHIRGRIGAERGDEPETNRPLLIRASSNIMIDHCSFSWGVDEGVSISMGSKQITIQRTIMSEGLKNAGHPDGAHSAGLLFNPGTTNISLHHNLFAHNSERNPRGGGGFVDVRNNVIYNYGASIGLFGDPSGITRVNWVGNFAMGGPSESSPRLSISFKQGEIQLYVEDNFDAFRTSASQMETAVVGQSPMLHLLTTPIPAPMITMVPATEVVEDVLHDVGANRELQDAVDARVIDNVRTRKGTHIDNPLDVGGWPNLVSTTPPPDTDSDGIPDAWEKSHNLSAGNSADAMMDSDGDGYLNIEEYLNDIATPLAK